VSELSHSRGIGIEDAVADVVIDGDGPAGFFEAGDHFAAELVPEGIDRDAAGSGNQRSRGGVVARLAGFQVEQETPGGVGLERGQAGVRELAGGGVFRGLPVFEDGGAAVRRVTRLVQSGIDPRSGLRCPS
jgi:hypothetical protein